jgi:membrane-bound lytic murein transglycosylase D
MAMSRSCFRKVVGFVFTLWFWGAAAGQATAELFPLHDSIRPNVSFWRDIYSKYTTNQGLLHDRQNLAIVYEMVELIDEREAGARQINKNRIDGAREKYERILKKLAQGERPATIDEIRVAALFGSEAGPAEFLTASEQIRFQLGQSNRFRDGVIRSGAYLDEIKRIIRSYNLPEDLAYLPHVESSFNHEAYSKFGAAGLWQFTRETGKQYMTVDYAVDERRDPIRATHAAAQYLRQSFDDLQCWPSAITSYNYGQAGMRRAKQAKGSYEAIFREYSEGWFKFASRNFYPEFLAAREVAKNYRLHFGELNLAPPLKASEIKLSGFMPVTEVSRRLSVNMETLQQLNPALREPIFTGQKYIPKDYVLRIPEKNNQQLVALMNTLDREVAQTAQKKSQFYRVKRGDTASSIARSQGIPLGELIAANQLNKRATVYVGQNLRIPGKGETTTLAAGHVKRQVSTQVKSVPQPPPAPVQLAKLSLPEEVVADVPPEKIIPEAAAPAEPLPASPAETETATAPGEVNPAVVTGNLAVEKVFSENNRTYGYIRVEPSETLGHFSDWSKTPLNDLRMLNGLSGKEGLQVHQQIKIPLDQVVKELFEERRYEYHKEIEEDFFTAFRTEGVRVYQIKKGDSIWSLCRDEFEVPFWLLKKYNESVDFNNLKPSQEIIVPIVEMIGEG